MLTHAATHSAAPCRFIACVAVLAFLSNVAPLLFAKPFFITPRESVDGRLTSAPVALIADQQLFSLTRGDFNVRAFGTGYGPDGDIAYVVRGKFLSMRNRMLIMDRGGRKLGASPLDDPSRPRLDHAMCCC